MDLVTRRGKKVDVVLVDVDLLMTVRLNAIRMEQCAMLVGDKSDLIDWVHCSDLVVDEHHGHKPRVWAHRLDDILRLDFSRHGIDRHIGHFKTFIKRRFYSHQNRAMLHI